MASIIIGSTVRQDPLESQPGASESPIALHRVRAAIPSLFIAGSAECLHIAGDGRYRAADILYPTCTPCQKIPATPFTFQIGSEEVMA